MQPEKYSKTKLVKTTIFFDTLRWRFEIVMKAENLVKEITKIVLKAGLE